MNRKKHNPPFIPYMLLRILLRGEEFHEFNDDINEVYRYMIEYKPRWKAKVWYWFRVLESIPGIILDKIYWRMVMFRSYFKIAVRNIKRHKSHSLINIFGLSMGLTCTIFIFLFAKDELSYDRFHENLHSIYRPFIRFHNPDGSVSWQGGAVQVPHGPALKEYFPEVKYYVRVVPKEFIVKMGNLVEKKDITMADKEFFEMFSFPLVQGNATSVLSDYSSIVLSESYAKKYFGEKNPIGKTMTLITDDARNDFLVSGVAKDPPSNSTVTFEMLINFESIRLFGGEDSLSNWRSLRMSCKTYIQLHDGKSAGTIEENYPEFAKKHYAANFEREIYSRFKNAPENIDPISFGLQRMRDIHFDPNATGSVSLAPVYILGGIALIILFIAGINFITLSIGNASRRCVELGIRKVLGAERRQLIRQYWSESVVMAGLAFIIGVGLACMFLPAFNRVTMKSLQASAVFSPLNVGVLIFITLVLGLSVGSYPALVLSRFHPVDIFRGKMKISGKNFFTRFLVILQFALSIFLIISTIVLGKQIHFMINQDLGFNKDNIVVVDNINGKIYDRLKNRLSNISGIKGITGTLASLDGKKSYFYEFKYKNRKHESTWFNFIDEHYFKTLEIDFLQGRNFSPEMSSDPYSVIVNETLVKRFEITDPIGQKIELNGKFFPIIGIVDDYHTMRKGIEIKPAVHIFSPSHRFDFMMIRVSSSEISRILADIQSVWKELHIIEPFSYSFLDEVVEAQYLKEKRWNRIVGYSSVLAVLIACLGVFGLTSITISRRTKEIGIRKVHGASVLSVLILLSRESVGWVLMANLIAWPAALFAMNKWLQNFAYKIHLSPVVFLMGALFMFLMVLLTTWIQTWKAARSNPVESLRYE
ncbi:MAG: ABC transporter permease [Candidatus Aminicenantes bacterium]|nr:ABC transporter permease [Candidatus Aminicenantes bacterium]